MERVAAEGYLATLITAKAATDELEKARDRVAKTKIAETVVADEWGTEHLPLTQVALAAAVPIIEAEVRAKIAAALEREWGEQCAGWRNLEACESCRAFHNAVTIARGTA